MLKSITTAAIVGTLSLVAVPALTGAAFAQSGPEPMQGAQPADAGAGSMEKGGGSMEKGSMEKSSMKSKHMKHSKHMAKHKKSM